MLAKPLRLGSDSDKAPTLISYLGRLDLLPVDAPTARLSLALAVKYGLGPAGATHLATAVAVDRFLTNNREDFPRSITELDVVYPDDLPGVTSPS
ncbi:type II toxin-antitoxin system VapC family toxin [Luteimicrobium sp. NPDC057192]|uniref:type II toxin-antitoxin system VapC family toxin n=1 Tax=Luteimicrobium sp. NPDC057192 TaxID=3346042 RepID=UPI00362CD1B8